MRYQTIMFPIEQLRAKQIFPQNQKYDCEKYKYLDDFSFSFLIHRDYIKIEKKLFLVDFL